MSSANARNGPRSSRPGAGGLQVEVENIDAPQPAAGDEIGGPFERKVPLMPPHDAWHCESAAFHRAIGDFEQPQVIVRLYPNCRGNA